MPRPRKAGLDYFYKGVHDWDEFAIVELVSKYGPMGYCIYDVILSKVYENGYFLEIPLDRLAYYVMKTIGNRWVRDKSIVLQVMEYCAEIGLFDNALLRQSVITSAEIQSHYSEVTARSKADKSKYWLLGNVRKNGSPAAEADMSADEVFAAKTPVFTENTTLNDADTPQSKANKTKENESKAGKSKAKPDDAAAAAASDMEETFIAITGRGFRQSDLSALEEMHAFGADDGMILNVMNAVTKRGNYDISSMRYFLPIVRESMQKCKSRTAGNKTNESLVYDGYTPTDSDEVERLLNEEWLALMSKYD